MVKEKNFISQVEQDWEEPAPGFGQRDPGLRLEADERPAQGSFIWETRTNIGRPKYLF